MGKKDKSGKKSEVGDDNETAGDLEVNTAKKKNVARFNLLVDEEDVDRGSDDEKAETQEKVDDEEEEDEAKNKSKAQGKKSKKERRKKKDDDDEDLDAIMAELALEIEGKKPPPKAEPKPEEEKVEEIAKDAKPSKKEKKKQQKQEVKEEPVSKPDEEVKAEGEGAEEKAEAKGKKKKTKKPAAEKPPEPEAKVDAKAEDTPATVEGEDVEEKAEGEDEEGEKKGKKKKGKKDEKDKKAGPGKKQVALMQEILRKRKEEEERLQREEEERIKQEEEAERLRQEQLRLEQERKDKKKQKEKERKERLKKEGKLLTAKQKADMARAKQSLELLKEQGVIIGRAKKATVTKQESTESKGSQEREPKQNGASENHEKEEEVKMEVEEEVKDAVKDNWEEALESESEEDESEKSSSNSKSTPAPNVASVPVKKVSAPAPIKVDPSEPVYRSPIVCVLGHVDTGKTKLLDYIRKTHVQDNEAGGITQQIGATFVPPTAINEQCRGVNSITELKLPGLLIIDTPGHESFTNLRSRGSSLCDIAILVIDIMHGIEPQTLESINLLKARKTPFIVALNKIDRLYNWKSNNKKDVQDLLKSQQPNTKVEFQDRLKEVVRQLNEQSLNAALFYENQDVRSYVSMVPTSAHTGDGMGNLINLLIHLTQSMMAKKLIYDEENLEATVLEVKAIPGHGTTIDVILVNGKLHEGDKVVLAGHDGPLVTQIRSLLVPQPLRELRVKTPYQDLKTVYGAMGVKIAAHDLDKAVAGLELRVAKNEAEIEDLKESCWRQFGKAMKAIKCVDKGVFVQASTLGSLEALLEFLKSSKIPYAGVRIGPVVKRDVMKASIMLESMPDFAVILAFDVRVERDAQELADSLGVKIFQAEIIYHLFDKFTAYREDLKQKRREQYRHIAIFPCKLRILPNCIFNTRDPIVVGVSVEDGILIPGTPIAVPSKGNLEIGRVSTIEINHKQAENARRGQEVCIKIDHCGGDAPKLYGRHFDYNDMLASRITRESIDACKEYFRDDLQKTDWQLMIELKKTFEIL